MATAGLEGHVCMCELGSLANTATSDHYLWPDEKFDIPRPVEERRRMLLTDLRRFPSFILDGDVTRWFPAPPFTPAQFYQLGLNGQEGSAQKRQKVLAHFGLPSYLSAKAMRTILHCYTDYEGLAALCETL